MIGSLARQLGTGNVSIYVSLQGAARCVLVLYGASAWVLTTGTCTSSIGWIQSGLDIVHFRTAVGLRRVGAQRGLQQRG